MTTDTSREAVQDAMSFISAHMGDSRDGLFVAEVLDALQARAGKSEAAARESALQELASLGQAAEAHGAQVKAEAERDALQAEVARLRGGFEFLLRRTKGADMRSMGIFMQDTSSVDEFLGIISTLEPTP